jgi:hypothetical protein
MKTFNHPLKLSRIFLPRKVFTGIHRIATKFLVALISKIPVGYEDETGFHYGIQMPSRRSPKLSRSPKPVSTSTGTHSGARKVNRPKRQYHKHVSPLMKNLNTELAGFSVPLLPVNLNDAVIKEVQNQDR